MSALIITIERWMNESRKRRVNCRCKIAVSSSEHTCLCVALAAQLIQVNDIVIINLDLPIATHSNTHTRTRIPALDAHTFRINIDRKCNGWKCKHTTKRWSISQDCSVLFCCWFLFYTMRTVATNIYLTQTRHGTFIIGRRIIRVACRTN